jgi:hypothetical protein
MTAVKDIAEVVQMKIFVDGISLIKHLLGLPVRARTFVDREEQVRRDGLLLTRIAQTCPELIVMASESRDHRP